MWLSVYACLFVGTLLNHLTASQSFFGEDRSFLEDLFDNRRHTKRLIKTSLFRPSLFHVIKFPNDECFDMSNQSGTCYTPLQCKAYGGTGTASCANGYGQCCIISRSCHNTTSQKVVYFKNPAFPQMNHEQNFCDLTIELKDSDVCQLKVDFLDFQMDQPTDGDCRGDKLKITATGLTPSSIPTLCGTNRNQHMYIHMPPDNKDRSVSFLFETNNNGPYRWHIRITQIDCVRNSYSSAFSTFGNKINNYRLKKRSVDQGLMLNNFTQIQSELDTDGDHSGGRKKRSLFVTEASLRMTIPAPPGCLQYHTSANGILESFNFGHYFNNLDYAICIERHPNICKVIFTCQDTGFGIETNNVGMQISEGAAGDEQCSMDYFMIPGGSTNGDFPTKDRYCGAKLTAIDYNGNNNNRQTLLGQQVVTKTNGPIVLRFHTDGFLLGKIRQGFRIKFEQSAENCQQANNNAATALVGYSASSALPFSSDRLNGISPPSLALKKESLSRFNTKRIGV